eukprot:GDKI01040596.1.p2 GENE.GDKI01040596.1~~GDKI01040596.1.p2  ORF type:complete len:129 (-),score=33.04 GDKI01040596.1:81-467(-)
MSSSGVKRDAPKRPNAPQPSFPLDKGDVESQTEERRVESRNASRKLKQNTQLEFSAAAETHTPEGKDGGVSPQGDEDDEMLKALALEENDEDAARSERCVLKWFLLLLGALIVACGAILLAHYLGGLK